MKIGANFPAKTPEGPIEDKWTSYKNKIDLVNPANKRLIDIIVVGTGLAGGSQRLLWQNWDTMSKLFVFKILLEELILSPRKAASMPRKITWGTVTQIIASSTIRSKAATFALGKRMFIAWQKYQATSLI